MISLLLAGTIAILNPIGQIQKGNDSKRKSDLSQIQKALEVYYNDFGKYPLSINNQIKNHNVPPPTTIVWGTSWSPYMSILPKDPKGGFNYAYFSNEQSYYLYAFLERGSKDQQVCTGTNNACSAPTGSSMDMQTACGGVCNFGVSSSNVSP